MTDISNINKSPLITDQTKKTSKSPITSEQDGAKFNEELKKSIDAMKKMGSAIDVANKNLESGPNNINYLTTNLNDVEKWIDRIHGVVNDISSPDTKATNQVKQAYEKAGQILPKDKT